MDDTLFKAYQAGMRAAFEKRALLGRVLGGGLMGAGLGAWQAGEGNRLQGALLGGGLGALGGGLAGGIGKTPYGRQLGTVIGGMSGGVAGGSLISPQSRPPQGTSQAVSASPATKTGGAKSKLLKELRHRRSSSDSSRRGSS